MVKQFKVTSLLLVREVVLISNHFVSFVPSISWILPRIRTLNFYCIYEIDVKLMLKLVSAWLWLHFTLRELSCCCVSANRETMPSPCDPVDLYSYKQCLP